MKYTVQDAPPIPVPAILKEAVVHLTRLEAIHIEAALDAFDDLAYAEASVYLGKYTKEYDEDLVSELQNKFCCIRSLVNPS